MNNVSEQLERISRSSDFFEQSANLTEEWIASGADIAIVEPILRFMENYPEVELGTPGPLVHYVERFYGEGYEEKLIESIARKPTSHTVWMLNRLINGAKSPMAKRVLIEVMEQAKANPLTNALTLYKITHFLERQSG